MDESNPSTQEKGRDIAIAPLPILPTWKMKTFFKEIC